MVWRSQKRPDPIRAIGQIGYVVDESERDTMLRVIYEDETGRAETLTFSCEVVDGTVRFGEPVVTPRKPQLFGVRE